jgi:hypothetical protein
MELHENGTGRNVSQSNLLSRINYYCLSNIMSLYPIELRMQWRHNALTTFYFIVIMWLNYHIFNFCGFSNNSSCMAA